MAGLSDQRRMTKENPMKRVLALVGVLAALFATPVLAQSTAQPVVTGYLTTSGCPTGFTSCFVQYGAAPAISGTVTIGAGSAIIGNVGIDQTTPGTTNGVVNNPTSASASAITPVVSASAESNHVLKGSAGNLYGVAVTPTVAGYLMVFNATSAPADGAVTPTECVAVPANATVSLTFSVIPEAYSTGITAVFSSTGCFTKTASATAFFKGNVQ